MSAVTDKLLQPLQPLRARAESELARLQPRERVMVAAGAVAVALALVYIALWKPVAQWRHDADQRLTDARQLAVQLEQAAVLAPAATAAPRLAANQSLLAAVDQAAHAGDLPKPPSRLAPDGDTRVRAWFDDVPFDALLHWMLRLQTQYGVHIDTVDIERRDTPGVVSARLSLDRGGT